MLTELILYYLPFYPKNVADDEMYTLKNEPT